MSRISNDCSQQSSELDALLNEETQSVDTSIPAPQPQQVNPDQSPAATEQKDTLENIGDAVKSWFTGTQKPKQTRPAYGPGNEPVPPKPPQTMLPPNATAAERKRAMQEEKERWGQYATDFGKYLENYREAFANCKNLDHLRNLEPEWPDSQLGNIPGLIDPAVYESLASKHNALFEEKVDRGYELLGEASPGTIFLVLKGKMQVGDFGGEVEAKLDSKGGLETGAKGGAKVARGLLKGELSVNDKGQLEGGVGIGGSSVKWGPEGREVKLADTIEFKEKGELEVGIELIPGFKGIAEYDAKKAIYGGGVSIGRKLTGSDGRTLAEVELEAKMLFKGMSKEDVKRALKGWLAKEPVSHEEMMRRQQAAAAIRA